MASRVVWVASVSIVMRLGAVSATLRWLVEEVMPAYHVAGLVAPPSKAGRVNRGRARDEAWPSELTNASCCALFQSVAYLGSTQYAGIAPTGALGVPGFISR